MMLARTPAPRAAARVPSRTTSSRFFSLLRAHIPKCVNPSVAIRARHEWHRRYIRQLHSPTRCSEVSSKQPEKCRRSEDDSRGMTKQMLKKNAPDHCLATGLQEEG